MIYKILFTGPQGSGKGTQAEKLSKKLSLPLITAGNMLREEKAKDTKLGKKIAGYIDKGHLVPDEITNELIKNRVNYAECKNGFIIDGYPRNSFQYDVFTKSTKPTHVLEIDIPRKESIKRISKRLICAKGHTYHKEHKQPRHEGICDIDGTALYQREDDKKSAILKRLSIYENETKPVIERYKKQNVYYHIDGTPSIDEVTRAIWKIFS